jgi:hypothetical protein
VTKDSVGQVKLGMTVAEVRKAVAPMRLSRTSDGEGVALIAVRQDRANVMTLYAGEENRQVKVAENAKIQLIEVWDGSYHTTAGVHPGMPLREAEAKLGKVIKIVRSEIESREYAEFTNQPVGVLVRVQADDGAGDYAAGEAITTRYKRDAYVASLIVRAKHESMTPRGAEDPTVHFTSVYSNLKEGCETSASDEGGHSSTFCKGAGDYRIHIFDSATTLEFAAENRDEEFSVRLASQALDYDTTNRRIEWRLANGRPFAAIIRTNTYQHGQDGLIAYPSKKTAEFLVIKGLKGYQMIAERIDATAPNANLKARALADRAFKESIAQGNRRIG